MLTHVAQKLEVTCLDYSIPFGFTFNNLTNISSRLMKMKFLTYMASCDLIMSNARLNFSCADLP
jgi:hypothetical protein